MKLPTQAEIARVVKATVRGYQEATGRVATATKVTFRAGEPIVEVTASEDSVNRPAALKPEGPNVEAFKIQLEKRHAARRT